MIGGIVIQICGNAIEVLDTVYLDRCWRLLEKPYEVKEGDSIWWQSKNAYLSRKPDFSDKQIGKCVPCNPFGK